MSIANEIQRLQIAKTDIKNAIENKGVTVGDGTIDTYAEKIDEIVSGDYTQGYEDGKAAEYDAFWDSVYQQIETTKTTFSLFSGLAWNDTNFKPPKDIVCKPDARYLFYRNGVRNLKACLDDRGVKIDFTNSVYLYYAFCECSAEHIGVIDFSTCTKAVTIAEGIVNRCANLITVDKIKIGDNVQVGERATNCTKLQNITYEGKLTRDTNFQWSPLLSDASIQSIIDALADLTDSDSQTLTLHADVGAKLTDEQKATITAKNWTLVY